MMWEEGVGRWRVDEEVVEEAEDGKEGDLLYIT